MSKKFSILTPTKNAMEYIDQCVSSVLEQDYENGELLCQYEDVILELIGYCWELIP